MADSNFKRKSRCPGFSMKDCTFTVNLESSLEGYRGHLVDLVRDNIV